MRYRKKTPLVGNATIRVIIKASKDNATILFHIGEISMPSGAVAATAACAIVPGWCTLTGESAMAGGRGPTLKVWPSGVNNVPRHQV